MSSLNSAGIEDAISREHSGDERQLHAIFSDARRIIIEAPAGYGKTKTMIGKLAYTIASNKLARPKRILALTFSVNAAYKIRKDVSEQLPRLLGFKYTNPLSINERLWISNYHGFCRHVLKLYGYLIHGNLRNIDKMRSIDDSSVENLTSLNVGLTFDDAKELSDLSDAVRNVRQEYINEKRRPYLGKVTSHFLPNNYITYNSILMLTLQLFIDYPEVLEFYHRYFPMIIIDEYQDTNILSYALVLKLISDQTKLVFIGDPLQRIYGFIGAVPDIIERSRNSFTMEVVTLNKNYRFKDNAKMLLLDRNIRLNAENPPSPSISEEAIIDLEFLDNQSEEAHWVCEKTRDLTGTASLTKVAILVRGRGPNVERIIGALNEEGVEYFYALYSDEDAPYIDFHKECLRIFVSHIKNKERITKPSLDNYLSKVKKLYEAKMNPLIHSLLDLLEIFLARIQKEYNFLTNEDKVSFVLDTLENRALKQQMEFVSKNVILSTVHGAKGLEWDYVILPDMEQYSFPNYYGLCGECSKAGVNLGNRSCRFVYERRLEAAFLEELSVFYVSVTRARKDVFFSASKKRLHHSGGERDTYLSCLLSLPGIKP